MSKAYCLAINTALDPFSYALYDGDKLVFEVKQNSSREFTEQLIYHIDASLKAQRLSFSDLSAVSLIVGPGSYTGIRVGFSVAKSIALVQNIPLYTRTSLQCLAEQSPSPGNLKVIIIPARKQEITLQVFSESAQEQSEPIAMTTDAFSAFAKAFEQAVLIQGQCPDTFKACLTENPLLSYSNTSISSHYLAKFGFEKLTSGCPSDYQQAKPFYLYEPVIGSIKKKKSRIKG